MTLSENTQYEICPKEEATRMRLTCISDEVAKSIAQFYAVTANGEGLIIEAQGKDVIVSSGSQPFSLEKSKNIFSVSDQNKIVYEKEI